MAWHNYCPWSTTRINPNLIPDACHLSDTCTCVEINLDIFPTHQSGCLFPVFNPAWICYNQRPGNKGQLATEWREKDFCLAIYTCYHNCTYSCIMHMKCEHWLRLIIHWAGDSISKKLWPNSSCRFFSHSNWCPIAFVLVVIVQGTIDLLTCLIMQDNVIMETGEQGASLDYHVPDSHGQSILLTDLVLSLCPMCTCGTKIVCFRWP